MRAFSGLFHPCIGHAEGEDVDSEKWLASGVGGLADGVDLLDLFIGHGEAADGDVAAVDHDEGSGSSVGFVVIVWETDVEGEVVGAVRVHHGRGNVIEALGHLAVSFGELGAEDSAGSGDGVFPEEDEFSGFLVFHKKLQLPLLFKSADEGWGA